MQYTTQELINILNKKPSKIEKEYYKYKTKFINNDSFADGYKLLTFEEYKDKYEKDDRNC